VIAEVPEFLSRRAPVEVAVPWSELGGDDSGYVDVLLVLLDERTGEVALTLPAGNGIGPRLLISYVFSAKLDAPGRPFTAVVDTSLQNPGETITDGPLHVRVPVMREYTAGNVTGIADAEGESLILSAEGQGEFGFIDSYAVSDTFEVQLEAVQEGAGAAGLTMYKCLHGVVETDSYVRMEHLIKTNGRAAIRVYATEQGETRVEEWWQKKHAYFEYELGDKAFGERPLALRIRRDARAGCLRFDYRCVKEIDGLPVEGWVEFPTLADWDARDFCVSAYVRCDDGAARGRFGNLFVRTVPHDDQLEPDVGFKVTRRPYTFSGVQDEAVVLTFDRRLVPYADAKFVFWRLANYIPWWHIDDKCAVSYEFVEIWGGGTTWEGEEEGGCCEPMSDRFLRWSNVDILEEGPARIIVRWQYVLANPEYQWWGRDPIRRPLVDERYCFYPDGVGVRRITYYPVQSDRYKPSWNEIAEPMVIQRGGVYPGEVINQTALSMLNLEGRRNDYTYLGQRPEYISEETKYWNNAIARINMNHRPAVYAGFSQADEVYEVTFPAPYVDWWANYQNDWHMDMKGGYEYKGDFWPFAHWPISRIPYENHTRTMGRYLREPGHTSILSVPGHPGAKEPTTWAMLMGLTSPWDDDIPRITVSSWIQPGDIKLHGGGCRYMGNDLYERALLFEQTSGNVCQFIITPDPVLRNPVVIIEGWTGGTPEIIIGDEQLSAKRYRVSLQNSRVIIWIEATLRKETLIRISSE
jgi:hypothetical protein